MYVYVYVCMWMDGWMMMKGVEERKKMGGWSG